MRKLRLALIAAIILGAAFPVAAQPQDTRNTDTRNSEAGRNGSVIQTDYDETYGPLQCGGAASLMPVSAARSP
jgi:hypothetical protein